MEVPSVAHQPVHELIARQPPGHALLQPFYTSPAIYRLDVERFLPAQTDVSIHILADTTTTAPAAHPRSGPAHGRD